MIKINIRIICLLLVISALASFTPLNAQDEGDALLPAGISLSNQLKYSFDTQKKREIFENWLEVDYRHNIFSAGIRLETFQPNDPNPAVYRSKKIFSEIAYRYIKAEYALHSFTGSITAGNFYDLFGRGLVLKIYEDRNLRIDNNLEGVRFHLYSDNFSLRALSGIAENLDGSRTDILHAADVEYLLPFYGSAGISYASLQPANEQLARTGLASLRVNPSFNYFDFYFEGAFKHNDDTRYASLNGTEKIAGKAFYGNFNGYIGPFALTTEYKIYDNFTFRSTDGSILYNTPPGVRKEHFYILLNRHPYPLNQDNEQGYQVDLNYSEDKLQVSFNAAETKSLPSTSYYQRILGTKLPVQNLLKEYFFSTKYDFSSSLQATIAAGYSEEAISSTKNLTPIVDVKYFPTEGKTIRLIFEHQNSENSVSGEIYYDDVLTLEYLYSPLYSISVVSELQTKEPTVGNIVRKMWNFVQFKYNFHQSIDFSILAGSRQAGSICIGGVCRYEPEFSGIELRVKTIL